MIFGIALAIVGYAVFIWGVHHFPLGQPGQSWPRYSLWCLLGLENLNLPSTAPLQLGGATAVEPPPTSGQGSSQQPPTGTVPGPPGTGTEPGQGSSSGGITGTPPVGWQTSILKGLGAPTSQSNIQKTTAWNNCEGNNPMPNGSGLPINNPFNITCDVYQKATCSGVSANSAGVQVFPTWAAGLAGTLAKIKEPFAAGIMRNLVQDGSFQDFATQVDLSGWGTNGACIYATLTGTYPG